MSQMRVGEILRYARPYDDAAQRVGAYANYFNVTRCDGAAKALLESGINPIGRVRSEDGSLRTPAILISSSPHREGGETTPWRDVFDVDNGHIRYFGDAKTAGADPAAARGNKALLAAQALQSSSQWRSARRHRPSSFSAALLWPAPSKGTSSSKASG